jgi:hypothetical protein
METAQETHHYGQMGRVKIEKIRRPDLQRMERSRAIEVCPYMGLEVLLVDRLSVYVIQVLQYYIRGLYNIITYES